MKTLLFIYNPAAGKAKITSALGEVTALFQKEDWLAFVWKLGNVFTPDRMKNRSYLR